MTLPAPQLRPSPSGPQTLLILDVETTGLEPPQAELCEIGAALFSVPQRSILQQLSFLLPVFSNDAQAINGIAPGLTLLPAPVEEAAVLLRAMVRQADALVAHNAAFDRPWIETFLDTATHPDLQRPWICTCEGITWEDVRPNPSLQSLALAHGVPIWAAHRALTDCIYLAAILERAAALEQKLLEGLLPRRLVAADLPFARKDEAKEAGFRWLPDRKLWIRKLTDAQIEDLPFPTYEVQL
ncbi:3'-5' exonuclease [Synechococcus sp. J7-Johnson]|uniref:exonuclease domain-containing protein n=1 Tax=Synechococcus sp. J7-Johnson TaxID=2823737 RepID=UPI0020CBB5BA|nr:exonuclease domain-containing protein [Synechococcus sp. J7-Johnson]MCP9841404.1 3'-5' exonuclease [Synechococcus sp. J7-Johnson]